MEGYVSWAKDEYVRICKDHTSWFQMKAHGDKQAKHDWNRTVVGEDVVVWKLEFEVPEDS